MFDKAKDERQEFMTIEHLLLALIENPEVAEVLKKADKPFVE